MNLYEFKHSPKAKKYRRMIAEALGYRPKKVAMKRPDPSQIPTDPDGKTIEIGDYVQSGLHNVIGRVHDIRISDRFERTGNYFIFIVPENGGKIVKTTQDDVSVIIKGDGIDEEPDDSPTDHTLGGSNY